MHSLHVGECFVWVGAECVCGDTDADRLGRELAVADKIGSGERMGGGGLGFRKIEG